ncbi:hypothetical protein [Brevibacillus sp. IT-7CA2]|uniref:hypothetical protein n=1 Tax=Brevibacillus sp. IT-7CA2 TaxID=3026436 RepID=UPI0039E0C666
MKVVLLSVLVMLPLVAVPLLINGIKHKEDHLILGSASFFLALVPWFWMLSQI